MTPARTDNQEAFSKAVLEVFDSLSGLHPGYRPAHAKGILLAGRFTPSSSAASLSRAPHLQRVSTPVTVRFSNTSGIPHIPDADPNAAPRGIAIRFHLAEHVHTDIIGHTVDGFPVRTPDEFLELLRAIQASGPGAASPKPIETFLGSHPAALAYVQAPKPVPVSFATESFFAVNAHRFVNAEGAGVYGRYRIYPAAANQYLDADAAAKQPPHFLFDEIRQRLKDGSPKMRIMVQVAAQDDVVNDSTVKWPADRQEVEFGTIELANEVPNGDAEQQRIIFDPIPRVDGIEPSDDPLLDARAAVYLTSGRRRRAGVRQE